MKLNPFSLLACILAIGLRTAFAADVRKRKELATSLMAAGLVAGLTDKEFAALLTYPEALAAR